MTYNTLHQMETQAFGPIYYIRNNSQKSLLSASHSSVLKRKWFCQHCRRLQMKPALLYPANTNSVPKHPGALYSFAGELSMLSFVCTLHSYYTTQHKNTQLSLLTRFERDNKVLSMLSVCSLLLHPSNNP